MTISFSGERCVFSKGTQQTLFAVEYVSADGLRRTPAGQEVVLEEQVILAKDRSEMTLRYPGGNEVRYVRLDEVPEMGTVEPLALGERPLEATEVESLKVELRERGERDQALRKELGAAMAEARREAESPEELQDLLRGEKVRAIGDRMSEIDAANTLRLLELVKDIGWIDSQRFGQRAARDAFLIVQHSGNLRLMRTALPLLEAEARADPETKGGRFALLYDRTVIALGERQRYGSQLMGTPDGNLRLRPLREPEKVDELRAQLGMEPLEEYLDRFRKDGRKVHR